MMHHEQAHDLLAAFALDAVETHERDLIDQHLANCPRCRAELDAHRDVAAALGNSVEQLPMGLWTTISMHLPERHDEDSPPMPRLLRDGPDGVVPQRKSPRRLHPSRGRMAAVASFVVAAAAVTAVLAAGLVNADNQVAHLQGAIGETAHTAVIAALDTPGHRVVDLTSAQRVELAQFVVLPDGRGYLVHSTLPALGAHDTYQLWGVVGGQPISLGLMGRSPNQVTFTLAGAARASKLGITVEPSGGAVVPSSQMVASGPV